MKSAAGRATLESLYSASLAGDLERSVVIETMWTAVGASRPADSYENRVTDRYWYPYDSQARIARFLVHNDERAARSGQLRELARREARLGRMFDASEQLRAHEAFDFVEIRPFGGVFEIWVIYYLPAPSSAADIAGLVRKLFPGQRFRLAQLDKIPLSSVGKLKESVLASCPIAPESPR
ncbi:hypothetical protein ACWDSJ_36165 [Nocardia sp. NPDC003482]